MRDFYRSRQRQYQSISQTDSDEARCPQTDACTSCWATSQSIEHRWSSFVDPLNPGTRKGINEIVPLIEASPLKLEAIVPPVVKVSHNPWNGSLCDSTRLFRAPTRTILVQTSSYSNADLRQGSVPISSRRNDLRRSTSRRLQARFNTKIKRVVRFISVSHQWRKKVC